MKNYFVYFMASKNTKALYIGVTNSLVRRVYEHKFHAVEGFTSKYNCVNLVYFEEASSVEDAIAREKQLKKWGRIKKENLINQVNPKWDDLSKEF